MDLREMFPNQQTEHHRPSGSVSSQWSVEMNDTAAVLSGNHPACTDIRENPGDRDRRDHLAYTSDTTTVSNK